METMMKLSPEYRVMIGNVVTSDELHEVDKLYPVISTIPSGTGWEVQVVADEVQGYDAESYPPNLEHAYVYYMENKLNRWRND